MVVNTGVKSLNCNCNTHSRVLKQSLYEKNGAFDKSKKSGLFSHWLLAPT